VKRREFITLLGGAAAAWPLAAGAQQRERMRRIGILMPYPQTEQEIQGRVRAFKEELNRLGWTQGSKIEFDERCPSTRLFQREFESAAPALGIEPIIAHIHGLADIERVIADITRSPNGALLFAPDVTVAALRERVVALVASSRLPAIYSDPAIVKSGGLASYSPDRIDLFWRSAGYVDRILRGEKPGDLPVQQPTKYEFLVNMKTAKTLGLEIPDKLLALADEVIE
jgi:ABC transporter substrate binding protein